MIFALNLKKCIVYLSSLFVFVLEQRKKITMSVWYVLFLSPFSGQTGLIMAEDNLKFIYMPYFLRWHAGSFSRILWLNSNIHRANSSSNFLNPLQWRHNERDGVSNHSLTIVYSTVFSGADHRKHQSSTSLVFVWGIHRWPVNSPHKWPVTRKMSPFDDVIMQRWPR